MKKIKINLGCGNNKWKGFINIDCDYLLRPDVVCDLRYEKLAYEENSVSEVWMCHTIEHIEKKYWPSVLFEVNRVLKIGGTFYLTYPEFLKCVEFWKDNKYGKKDYFEACIYGRQASPSDFHVSLCHTPDMIYMFKNYGFGDFVHSEENEPQYSALSMVKKSRTYTKEDMLKETVFGGR